jgi:predicted Zn-dependent protease
VQPSPQTVAGKRITERWVIRRTATFSVAAVISILLMNVTDMFIGPCRPIGQAAQPALAAGGQGDHTEAVQFFNKANDSIKKQDMAGAVTLLMQACQADDSFAAAHANLGYCLLKTGRQAEAKTELEKATALDPKMPEPWPNLGQIYVATGNLTAATHAYETYLQLAGDTPYRHNIEQNLISIKQQMRTAVQGGSNDYFQACNDRGIYVWKHSPIKVFIASGDGVAGFKPAYKGMLMQAFSDWSAASSGRISFVLSAARENSDIVCTWSSDVSRLKTSIEGGQADWKARSGEGLTHVDVLLLTVDPAPSVHLTDAMMGWVAHHELGHALGIHGHSTDPNDVMYFSATPDSFATKLSQRDKNTLAKLYNY